MILRKGLIVSTQPVGYSIDRQRCKGITLIELLLALGLLSILVALSAQSFSHWQRQSQLEAQAQSLLAAVYRARTLAVALDEPVTLCPGGVDGVCGGNYSDGFSLISASRGVIRTWSGRTAVSVFNRDGSATVTHTVTWTPRGLANRNLTWSLCAPGVVNQSVVLNRLGRPRLHQGWGMCPH